MQDFGMTENSEHLTVIPAQYIVIRQKRHKYRCVKCHGSIVTAPAPPKIKPGSSYSDEMVIDIAMSKYCDLIPTERYAAIAGREGLSDLPPQSLIEQTHYLADFVEAAYQKQKQEVFESEVVHADETPHRMLEQNDKKSSYLWGFTTKTSSYFEIRNTRSGDVASELLMQANARYLISDVFSGYRKAVREANEARKSSGLLPIKNIYCNAHARRKFKDAHTKFPDEAQVFIDLYKKIYRLEKIAQKRPPDRILRVRRLMRPVFQEIRKQIESQIGGYSNKSSIGMAMSYFLRYEKEFTLFTENAMLPIDNNPQERLLRDPVIGRKTWYGNHSKRGAKTTAILFSLVQSCKLNGVNPREYFKRLVQDLHQGHGPYTPAAYASNAG
jgi:transposase